jgi:urease accessory protein
MKTMHRVLLAGTALASATAAQAHTGHGAEGLAAGLAHPLGADHLLAMLAVGLWSAAALVPGRRWQGPAMFLVLLALGAVAGAAGLALPLVEVGIALSVSVFGAMLLAPKALPIALGLALVGFAAALHGLAHGAELPTGSSFAGYAAGFLLSSALLHALGLALGRWLLPLHVATSRLIGTALGLAGLVLWALA